MRSSAVSSTGRSSSTRTCPRPRRARRTIRFEQPVRRGTIFDRSGTVVLATSVERYRVAAAPDQLTPSERRDVGAAVSSILGLDPEAAAALAEKIDAKKAYVILARGLEPATADRIRASIASGDLKGIALESEPVRVFPQQGGSAGTTLAAHLLGFVNRDGQGQYGVEQRYQAELAGTPQVLLAERDAIGPADHRHRPGRQPRRPRRATSG